MKEVLYRQIIKIKDDVPVGLLSELSNIAEDAFDNRAGKTCNVSDDPYTFIFEGDESLFGCLSLGMSGLYRKRKDFVNCVADWKWIDVKHPYDNSDILKDLAFTVY